MPSTTNYGWTLPTVGGDSGAWGTILNAAISAIDAALKTVSDVASAALPEAGGTMTGTLHTKAVTADCVNYGPLGGAVDLDVQTAQAFTITVAAPLTLTLSNVPAGSVVTGVSFLLTNPGAFAFTWPPGTVWNEGAAPTLTASGVDHIALITYDNGTTWHGVVIGQDIS